MNDEPQRQKKAHELGEELSLLSVAELTERVDVLIIDLSNFLDVEWLLSTRFDASL